MGRVIGDPWHGYTRRVKSDVPTRSRSHVVVEPLRETEIFGFVDVIREVAEEGGLIATEAPVDVSALAARVRTQLTGGPDALYVARDQGRVIGCLGLHPTLNDVSARSLGMCIRSPWRSQGIGRALVLAGLGWARRSQIETLMLEVFPHNASAISFYAQCGFEIISTELNGCLDRNGSPRAVHRMMRPCGRADDGSAFLNGCENELAGGGDIR